MDVAHTAEAGGFLLLTHPDPFPTSKDALRAQMLERARAATPDERQADSRRIQSRVLALPAFAEAKVVALYAPFLTEPETALLFSGARAAGKVAVFPGYAEQGEPELREVRDLSDLASGRHGFAHPRPGSPVQAAAVDLFVVPGVAFDREGNRLGRGGGYYDRLLAAARPGAVRVGLCFDPALVERAVPEAHDVPVDYVATPSALWARAGQAR